MTILYDIVKNTEIKTTYSGIKLKDYLIYDNAVFEALKSDKILTMSISKYKYISSIFEDIEGIYIIINLTNNKVYVGQTRNLYRRIKAHRSKLLKRALDAGDTLIVKFVSILDDEVRSFWERWFIKYYEFRYTSCNIASTWVDKPDDYIFERHPEDICQTNLIN